MNLLLRKVALCQQGYSPGQLKGAGLPGEVYNWLATFLKCFLNFSKLLNI